MFTIRQQEIIKEICKYDEWFATLVNFKSYEVIEKMNHFWENVNLGILSEKSFSNLITQIELFYKERLDPNSYWESMTDFNYQVKFTWNDSRENFDIDIVEKYPYDSDTDDESEELIDEKDIEDKESNYNSLKTDDFSTFEVKIKFDHNEEHKDKEILYKQDNVEKISEKQFNNCDDNVMKANTCHGYGENSDFKDNNIIIKSERYYDMKDDSLKMDDNNVKNIIEESIDTKMYSVTHLNCITCGLSFPNEFEVKSHYNLYSNEAFNSCDICYFVAESKTELKMHIELMHKTNSADEYYDSVIEPLIIALLAENDSKPYLYQSLDESEIEYDDTLIQLSEDLDNTISQNYQISYGFTKNINPNSEFSIKEEIEKVLDLTHSEINYREEIESSKKESVNEDTLVEMKKVKDFRINIEMMQIFETIKIESIDRFHDHIRKENGEISHIKYKRITSTCNNCNKQFPDENNFIEHIKSIHKTYACKICGNLFAQEKNMILHSMLCPEVLISSKSYKLSKVLKRWKNWKRRRKKSKH